MRPALAPDPYAEMLAELFAARRLGVRPGLDAVQSGIVRLGRPDQGMGKVLHVGGTNGKGSTAAFLEAALTRAGLRTGLYTSPHLVRFSERFRVAGVECSAAEVARLYRGVRRVAVGLELTFFELATLIAVCAFAEAHTDVAILEVGLGGRLDATNAIHSDVAIVTGVELDHQDLLGASIESIAREKAGIFHSGGHAVIGAAGAAEGARWLEEHARAQGASEVVVVGRDAPGEVPSGWTLGLRGAHQRTNAATALAGLDALWRATGGSIVVPVDARCAGLAGARWPGRLELVGGSPPIWLDAAHNPDGARALARALATMVGPRVLVVGICADKDVAAILLPLVPLAEVVVATRAPTPRALSAEALAALVSATPGSSGCEVLVESEPLCALAKARMVASGRGGLLAVCGSIFLVGMLRAALTGETVDPLAVQDPAPVRRGVSR